MKIGIGNLLRITVIVAALILSACGGGGSVSPTATLGYTIGGTVSGLTGTVVLQDNGGDNLTVTPSGNATFTFATPVKSGNTYAVRILTQPTGQICSVSSGAGTISGNVSNVGVNCVTLSAPALPVSFSPAIGTPLLITDTLTVTFAQAMNSGTATITPAGGTWNAANTIYTFPALTAGSFNVSISATSAAGDRQVSLNNISYNVYDPATTPFVYVSPTGDDVNGTGALATPFATIAKAISFAVQGQAVLVAGGTYIVDSGAATPTNIVLTDVSLYGGYAADFASRDPAVNVTTITDVATAATTAPIKTDFGTTSATCVGVTAVTATAGTPMAAVSVGVVTGPVTIDGFSINGSSNASTVNSAAVSVNNPGAGILMLTNDT